MNDGDDYYIVLPDNPIFVRELREKLTEYRQRASEAKDAPFLSNPVELEKRRTNNRLNAVKIFILADLLDKGTIELGATIQKVINTLDPDGTKYKLNDLIALFSAAWWIIESYVKYQNTNFVESPFGATFI